MRGHEGLVHEVYKPTQMQKRSSKGRVLKYVRARLVDGERALWSARVASLKDGQGGRAL